MRHRRHTLTHPLTHPHTQARALRATAAMPCVAALLMAALAGAAPGPYASDDDGPRRAAVLSAAARTAAKSQDDPGSWHAPPSPSAPPRTEENAPSPHVYEGDLYEGELYEGELYEGDYDDGPRPAEHGSAPDPDHTGTTAATGEVSPVLPLGAGLTMIGLGLALIALRLRRT